MPSPKIYAFGMRMELVKRVESWGALILAVMVLGACSTPYSSGGATQGEIAHKARVSKLEAFNQRLFKAAVSVGEVEYRLGPGDIIQVTVFGIKELEDLEGELDSLGRVSLPLVGEVKLGGLTLPEAQKTLTKAFSKYVLNPRVSLAVKEYHSYRVSVLGEVNKPDVYSLRGGRTLLDVLAMAGGLTSDASHTITLVRLGKERKSMIVDLDQVVSKDASEGGVKYNIILQPGDVVYVPRAGSVFVDGFVNKPGSFPLSTPITLTQAIALAGGMRNEADTDKVAIYRMGEGGKRYVIQVDLYKVKEGKIPDPTLQDNDVVVVPSSGMKVFVSRFLNFFGFGFTRATGGGAYGMRVGNQ
ncbi:MAG TPA: hypothetical protein ENF32_01810 [Thermosulfidibacter takaii]|uniref:Polysaccharide export protein n=1 Tax=Thermosulfidibacter takaii TaxID=412593 RepID=A0A7C0U6B0_9BACT|nr:hypothetical protein [Thermosulfidibacter takaii]